MGRSTFMHVVYTESQFTIHKLLKFMSELSVN